jgi:hypothetical protein
MADSRGGRSDPSKTTSMSSFLTSLSLLCNLSKYSPSIDNRRGGTQSPEIPESSTRHTSGTALHTNQPAEASTESAPQQLPTRPHTMSRHASSQGRSQQYQLVSPGTPADPRAMSQVSPGFIFVNFLCLCVWLLTPSFPSVSYVFPTSFPFLSHIAPLTHLRGRLANRGHRTTRTS